jgi:hypothetical protein
MPVASFERTALDRSCDRVSSSMDHLDHRLDRGGVDVDRHRQAEHPRTQLPCHTQLVGARALGEGGHLVEGVVVRPQDDSALRGLL